MLGLLGDGFTLLANFLYNSGRKTQPKDAKPDPNAQKKPPPPGPKVK
jgi:hypothetical protein